MSTFPTKGHKLTMLTFIVIFSFLSCSKDSDLIADYVSVEPELKGVKLVANDSFKITSTETQLLNVLDNDNFRNSQNVSIVRTTSPAFGSVSITEDNQLSYTPSPTHTTDNFTYTAEVENEDGSVSTDTGNVEIEIVEDEGSKVLSEEIQTWKNKFDQKWAVERSDAFERARSKNLNQEYYYLGYYIDGLTSIWQATGENEYLDEALDLIGITVEDAKLVGDGLLGWPSSTGDELALWDSFYWRHVATLVRILDESPNLRASGYQSIFEDLLEFSEIHIWTRYELMGLNNFYRSRTHMASHWARIGMELYLVTGKEKYLEVFENISHGTMFDRPSNLRSQIYPNPKNTIAYAWDSEWGVPFGTNIQDSSHGGAVVSFLVLAYENGMYWTKQDIDALVATFNVIWPENDMANALLNIDGSGGDAPDCRVHEWLNLGRYDRALQNRIKNNYVDQHLKHYGSQAIGIAALNEKILLDSEPVYPEE